MEPIGCLHHTSEPRSGDYPGSEGCIKDHCTNDHGGFDPEYCPDCDDDHGCGRDCPGFEAAA